MKRDLLMILLLSGVLLFPLHSAAFHESQIQYSTPNEFASLLTLELNGRATRSNLLFSPLSVHSALSMTSLGAQGSTKMQMDSVLGPYTEVPESKELSIANAIWIDTRYPVAEKFISRSEQGFSAKVGKLAFQQAESVDTINSWVDKATNGKIDSIIDSLDPHMRMVLVNAVHFLADWSDPFDPNDTRDRIFQSPKGGYPTPFMHAERTMSVVETDGATGVALPYEGGRFVFVALLPPEDVALEQWIGEQHGQLVDRLFQSVATGVSERVDLALPKFLDRFEAKLSGPLKSIGMTEPFDPSVADFSRMHAEGRKDLFIDEVLHKTFIRVDEKGTEAAAVTAVMMRLTSIMPSGRQIVFDRPFFYSILDTKTDHALFIGTMSEPIAP
jgi:serpin B